MDYRVLVINPGSTSTKLALYEGKNKILQENISHSIEDMRRFPELRDQVPFRLELIRGFMERNGIDAESLDAVIGRGGLVIGLKTGGYRVTDELCEALLNEEYCQLHASNLGGILARDIAQEAGKPAFIYDAVTSGELLPEARITGIKDIVRRSQCHVLNARAMAMKFAQDQGKRYEDLNLIVSHLGGGISTSVHRKGVIIDSLGDDDGQFAPERSGSVPGLQLVDLCYSGKYNKTEMKQLVRGKGGMFAHLGTSDCREIERRINAGDEYADLVFQAQALQIAKGIGLLEVNLKGKLDAIILTGGVAYSKMLTDRVIDYVGHLAPVYIYPGENEMEALAFGCIRMLDGEEECREYHFSDRDSGKLESLHLIKE